MDDSGSRALDRRYLRWRFRVVLGCWVMYASYYLARVNMSLAQPVIRDDLGYTDIQMGWVATSMLITYGIGQVVSGLLGDRFGARVVVTVGMFGTALCNLLFGFCEALWLLVLLWALNGFMQSTGAPMRIRTVANWFPPQHRGKIMGLAGTDYQAGNLFCWLLVGLLLLPNLHWQYAFWVPAAILVGTWAFFVLMIRDQPEDVGLPPIEAGLGTPEAGTGERRRGDADRGTPAARTAEHGGGNRRQDPEADEAEHPWGYVVKRSLGNPKVWVVGFAYFGVDMIRYGFLVWAPTFMYDQGAPVSQTAYKMVMMPAAAVAGILASGWLTDRLGGRRAPVISVMLLVVAVLAWIYPRLPSGAWGATMGCLAAIGFFLYGPHLLMGSTIAMDLGSRKAAGAASGLIDGLGYAGAAVATAGTAYVKEAWGWNAAFYLWIAGAIMAAALMLILWNYKPPTDRKYA